jgi:phosphatidylglycerophosphatase A
MSKRGIVSFGGIGFLPAMPGTFASLAAAILFYLLWLVCGDAARWVLVPLILIVSALTVALGRWAEVYFKAVDPRQFVLDEVAGQWLTLLFVPLSAHVLPRVVAAFFLFRVFDVAKPFPIRRVERLPAGWGILLDDVVAAVYAGIAFRALLFVVNRL